MSDDELKFWANRVTNAKVIASLFAGCVVGGAAVASYVRGNDDHNAVQDKRLEKLEFSVEKIAGYSEKFDKFFKKVGID